MPYELTYSSEAEIKEKIELLKKRGVKVEECIIKVNKNNVKLKIRAKRTLYTIVLSPEKIAGGVEELKAKAQEYASLIGCEEPKVL